MTFMPRLANAISGCGLAAALVLSASPCLAQAKPAQQRTHQPAPAAKGGQAQPQDAGPLVVQVKAEPSQPDWTKVCGKDPASNVESCYTTRDFVSDTGQRVLSVALYDIQGQKSQKMLRVLMPLGLLVPPGLRAAVDKGQPVPGRYTVCFPTGCFAEAKVENAFLNALKKGTNLSVSARNQAGREVTFAVPAEGFGKAFDGPPVDPQVIEERQKKVQEELQKQSDELRKRLMSNPAAPSQSPAPSVQTTQPKP